LKQRHEVVLGRARGRNCLSLVFLHWWNLTRHHMTFTMFVSF
jgi:hypothetical protein